MNCAWLPSLRQDVAVLMVLSPTLDGVVHRWLGRLGWVVDFNGVVERKVACFRGAESR